MRVLLVAGAGEARQIAHALWGVPNLSVTVFQTKEVDASECFGWPVRDASGVDDATLFQWVGDMEPDGIIDAEDTFRVDRSVALSSLSQRWKCDYVKYLPPFWVPTVADNWTFLGEAAEASQCIPKNAVVFADLDYDVLQRLGLPKTQKVIWRGAPSEQSRDLEENVVFHSRNGPTSVAGETRLMGELDVDWLVVRNTGGQYDWPKLEAARELGVRVALLRRPQQPDGPKITTVSETVAWVRRRG